MGFQYACGLASRIHPPPSKISPALPITFRSPPAHTTKDALPSNRTHASHPSNRPSRRAPLSRPLRNPLPLERRPAMRQRLRSTRFALHPPHPTAALRDWLTVAFYKEFEIAPSPVAFRSGIRVLEARAKHGDFPSQKLDRHLGFEGDSQASSKSSSTSPIPPARSSKWIRMAGASATTRITPSASPSARSRFLARSPRSAISRLLTSPMTSRSFLSRRFRPRPHCSLTRERAPSWRPVSDSCSRRTRGQRQKLMARALRFRDPSPALVRMPDRDEELPAYAFETGFSPSTTSTIFRRKSPTPCAPLPPAKSSAFTT